MSDADQNLKDAANEVRVKRISLLNKTDWMFTVTDRTDVPNKEYWAEYRQALRDITKQSGFPLDVVWPTPPDQKYIL